MPASGARRMWLLAFSALPLLAAFLTPALARPRAARAEGAVGAPCSEAQLDAALAGGGAVSFNCGGPVTITFSAEKFITLPTTLDGANGGLGPITFSGGGSVRLFHVAAGAQLTLVNGLALVAGSAPGPGGAIWAEAGANLFAADARFEGNQAGGGGGALALAGAALISRSAFIGNSSLTNGGAISNSAALFVAQSSFASNQARQGGALYAAALLTVTQSTFSTNSTLMNGGAIFVEPSARLSLRASEFSGHAGLNGVTIYAGGPVDIAGSTFHDNGSANAGTGGAIETWSQLDVLNSTFSQNQGFIGGAIVMQAGLVQITNTTFVSNTAGAPGHNGGHIWAASAALTPSLRILNSVLAGGDPNNCSAALTSLGGNAEDADSCGFTQPGDQPRIDPRLGPLQPNAGAPGALALTHMPLPGSPLVDAARLAGCPPADQRGRYRPSGSGCDVGAVEVTQPLWLPLILR